MRAPRAALDNRRARQDPHLAAPLHARLAVGQPRTAERTAAARCLLTAGRAYDRIAPSASALAELAFLTPDELSGLAASSTWHWAATPAPGPPPPMPSALIPTTMRRNRPYGTVLLAELQPARGECEQAEATAAGLDAFLLDSRRIIGRLATVRRTLTTQESRSSPRSTYSTRPSPGRPGPPTSAGDLRRGRRN
ncbi:hypothetical protein [Streptomyces sp. NPDC048224]|uniref:hypothetical protein n=1 Tax=Streptomyces sp. NPDC048224 TaxID=3154500 RepID=UPI0033C7123F